MLHLLYQNSVTKHNQIAYSSKKLDSRLKGRFEVFEERSIILTAWRNKFTQVMNTILEKEREFDAYFIFRSDKTIYDKVMEWDSTFTNLFDGDRLTRWKSFTVEKIGKIYSIWRDKMIEGIRDLTPEEWDKLMDEASEAMLNM